MKYLVSIHLDVMMATSPQIYDYEAIHRAIEEYYSSDKAVVGSGPYVHGTIFSKGRGLRSFIRKAIKIAAPIVKKAGKILKPMAKQAGQYALNKGAETARDIAADVLEGVPVEEAFRHNGHLAIENMKYDAAGKLRAFKRKQKTPPKVKNSKFKKKPGLQ